MKLKLLTLWFFNIYSKYNPFILDTGILSKSAAFWMNLENVHSFHALLLFSPACSDYCCFPLPEICCGLTGFQAPCWWQHDATKFHVIALFHIEVIATTNLCCIWFIFCVRRIRLCWHSDLALWLTELKSFLVWDGGCHFFFNPTEKKDWFSHLRRRTFSVLNSVVVVNRNTDFLLQLSRIPPCSK